MSQELKDFKVAILVAEGFEQVELTEPKKALENAQAAKHRYVITLRMCG